MSIHESKKELRNFIIRGKFQQCKVVVLPDFFLDRLIDLKWTFSEFSDLLSSVAKRKGGSIDGVPQTDIRGGNAINVASALANLGAQVTPIVCTSNYGLQQIQYYLRNIPMEISHIKVKDKASVTTAFELKNKNEKTNVMIRDLGSLSHFGPNDLNDSDYEQIRNADFTCLFNWAGTLEHGTELAQVVFAKAHEGKGKTYYDTADPSPNSNAAVELMEKVLKSNSLDILSVNENEAIIYASMLDKTLSEVKTGLEFEEVAMEAARILARNLSARVDLHTTVFSASLKGKREVVVPTFKVNVFRATGAGDAWTAGNIVGDRNNLTDECRLLLANAVSASYLSDPQGMHPSWSKLSNFIKDNW